MAIECQALPGLPIWPPLGPAAMACQGGVRGGVKVGPDLHLGRPGKVWTVVDGDHWVAGTLPGRVQTVFRAELYAVVFALEATVGDLQVVSDCRGGG